MCSRSTTKVGFYITCVDEPQEENMEFVPLSDVALHHLALDDPILKRGFHGVHPSHTTRAAYIVNMDTRGEPGKHWLGLWMEEGACEVMDSYGLPLTTYQTPGLHDWLGRRSPVWRNDWTLQALNSTACGHYAVLFLKERARGQTMEEFLEGFFSYDFVGNDRMVGNQVRRLSVQDLNAIPLINLVLRMSLLLFVNKKRTSWKRYACLVLHK